LPHHSRARERHQLFVTGDADARTLETDINQFRKHRAEVVAVLDEQDELASGHGSSAAT